MDKVVGLHPDKGLPGCYEKLIMLKAVRQWDRDPGENYMVTISAGSGLGFRLIFDFSGTFQVCLPGFWKW